MEELLAERGLDVSYETVRRWVLKFGPAFARTRPSDQWHLDEMAVVIGGKRLWLWRAVDSEGEIRWCSRAGIRPQPWVAASWTTPRGQIREESMPVKLSTFRLVAVLSAAVATESSQAKDPWKHYYKQQDKEAREYHKYERKQAKAWEKYERKRPYGWDPRGGSVYRHW